MGLLKALMGSVGGTLADQWKEYFYCDSMPEDVLAVKGKKRVSGRSANRENDNIITNGSIIAVAAMAPKGETLLVLAGVVVAAAVSFFVAAPIVKRAHLEEVKPVQKPNGTVIGGTSRAPRALEGPIRTVVFACDASFGQAQKS